jgi:hypothetical protein
MGHRDEGGGAKAGVNWARRAAADADVRSAAWSHLWLLTAIRAARRDCLAFGAIRLASMTALPLFVPRSPEALTESLGIVWLSISSQDKRSIAARDQTLIAVDPPRIAACRQRAAGGRQMEYSDYLRDQAAEYRRLAESANDPTKKEDLFESAAIYEMVANDLDDRRPAG